MFTAADTSMAAPEAVAPQPALAINHVVLQAELAQRGVLRYTPAGIAALDLVLKHESMMHTAMQPVRQVQVELKAVAFGELAQRLERMSLGESHVFRGYLNGRRGSRSVVLHLTEWN